MCLCVLAVCWKRRLAPLSVPVLPNKLSHYLPDCRNPHSFTLLNKKLIVEHLGHSLKSWINLFSWNAPFLLPQVIMRIRQLCKGLIIVDKSFQKNKVSTSNNNIITNLASLKYVSAQTKRDDQREDKVDLMPVSFTD